MYAEAQARKEEGHTEPAALAASYSLKSQQNVHSKSYHQMREENKYENDRNISKESCGEGCEGECYLCFCEILPYSGINTCF